MTEAEHFRDELVTAGLLVPSGVPGVFARSARFEDVTRAFDRRLDDIAREDGARTVHFPPVVNRDILRRTGYMENFPHLCGSIHSFAGDPTDQAALIDRVQAGEDWGPCLHATDVTLAPAGCYPLYPTLAGSTLPASGELVDLCSWVFRHEPSPDPARMQAFRMHENIRIGSEEEVVAWRDRWMERGRDLLTSLGVDVQLDVAHDPFFGRAGRMMGRSQVDQRLKFELLAPLYGDAGPTALASFNDHQRHYGSTFEITTADGEAAHSGCIGFGLERVTLALFRTHGKDPARWPSAVRERLWS